MIIFFVELHQDVVLKKITMIDPEVAEKLKKEDFVTIFLVNLHLDVVPKVHLMVGMNFLTHKSHILLS